MSFKDFDSGPSWGGARNQRDRTQSDSSPEVREIKRQIREIQQDLARVRRMVNVLGTRQDSIEHRQNLRSSVRSVMKQAQHSEALIANLGQNQRFEHKQERELARIQQQKLAKDFLLLFEEFKQIQADAKRKENEFSVRSASHNGHHVMNLDEEETTLLHQDALRQQQEYQQIEKSLEFNQAVAFDREESIMGIEQEIAMVQDIFKDLAVLVEDQGLVIDDIEQNVVNTLQQAKDGTQEVDKAAKLQKKARNKMCFLLICLLVVAGIIVAIVLTT